MKVMLPDLLAASAFPGSSWTVGWEGISPGAAAVLLALLLGATVLAYWRWAPGVKRLPRLFLIFLRALACIILVALLARPVLMLSRQEPVRQPLAVLVDGSQSMAVADRRETDDDLKRAAIAAGTVKPDKGLAVDLPSDVAAHAAVSRTQLLQDLTANPALNLWPRLARQTDLLFYGFGRTSSRAGDTVATPEEAEPEKMAKLLQSIPPAETATGIGEALREVLQESRPQALGGILLITDGNSNTGSSALEAAAMCKDQGVPLFIYGTGVTSPRDIMVHEVQAPKLAYAGERLDVVAKISAQGMTGKPVTVALKQDGVVAEEKEVTLDEREAAVTFHLTPDKAGDLRLEVTVPVQPGEASAENNTASTMVRVIDRKFQVLLIEQEPRWDFRYLLDYLQRDPRLEVKCVMIDGEPGLDQLPESPFLPALPDTRDAFFSSQVLILGDVDPADLGEERMRIIADWVEAGGGIIFLAGPNHSPNGYEGTPLEPLLPVVPDASLQSGQENRRSLEPFQLRLTRQGERSPYLQMDPDPETNLRIWDAFPGVRWTAPVARLKPGAEVLLVDPQPANAGRYGMLPVFAMQGYGSGTCVYFGTDETYRWRSRTGEKYYSILWGQIMQSLSLQLQDSASAMTQLRTDRKQYAVGDTVTLSGRAWTAGYEPLLVPSLDGTLSWRVNGKPVNQALTLHAGVRNSFKAEFVPEVPGSYTFVTSRDPDGVVRFDVVDTRLESSRTALNDRFLQGMAEASGGKFIREEDLFTLPELIASKGATVVTFRKLELYHSAWALAALFGCLFVEWFVRKLVRLK